MKTELFKHQDLKFKAFHSKLIPTVDPDTVIGVRTPILKKLAKQMIAENKWREFISCFPHYYYEENNLHAFILSELKDYDECVKLVDRFLPYVNNWATCDQMRPKSFNKNQDKLIGRVFEWIKSDKPYTVRFGIETLMMYFSKTHFDERFVDLVKGVKSEHYYVKMMIAWYFATLLVYQWDVTVKVLQNRELGEWEHKKTVQKALESFRISKEKKDYLRSL